MSQNIKRAARSVTAFTAAVCLLGMTGCASIAGGSQSIGNAVGVKDRTMASTVGGCLAGGLVGGIAGALAKGGIGAVIGVAGGCAAGGFVSRDSSIQEQLAEARKNEQEINATLASVRSTQQAMIYTSMVKSTETAKTGAADGKVEDHKIEKWDKTVVPMPAGHGADVQTVLKKVASLTAASKKVPRIDMYVKRADEASYSDTLNAALQGTKVMFSTHVVAKNPHLDVTPIPDPAAAAAK